MIDPHNITNFDRDERGLQEMLMFAVVVAGKRADQQAVKLERLIRDLEWHVWTGRLAALCGVHPHDYTNLTPLGGLWALCGPYTLRAILRDSKIGQYRRIGTCFIELAYSLPHINNLCSTDVAFLPRWKLDLRTVAASELEQYYGIGPKTARFFILHTRPEAQVACLDTHVLAYMRNELGIETPRSTPNGDRYLELEQAFLAHAKDLGRDVAELDLEIWNRYTKSNFGRNSQVI